MKLARPLAAEALGTALLLAVIVGSGIMGQRLSSGNDAIALLGNTMATGTGLIVLIQIFGPISGAHFNPAVTLTELIHRRIGPLPALAFMAAQFSGAVAGVWLAHAMFAEPLFEISTKLRSGPAQGLSELVATFGLIGTIVATQQRRPESTPVAVGLYIMAAYWFTASTSFANPAVTVARALTDSFAGIAPSSVPLFIVCQLAGTLLAIGVFGWLLDQR